MTAAGRPLTHQTPSDLDAAIRFLDQWPLLDGHNDLTWRVRVQAGLDFDRFDLAAEHAGRVQTDIPRLRAGRVGGHFWVVLVPPEVTGAELLAAALEQFDAVHRMAQRYAWFTAVATSADEIEAVLRSGRFASLIGVEGGHQIVDSLGVLRTYHRLGARYLTLVHAESTAWADSCSDAPISGGLNEFGHEVVRELNRLGMMADLSHAAHTTMNATLDTSVAPAFFSHSNAYELCPDPRNVPDDVLKRVAGTAGLVMVSVLPGLTTPDRRDWQREYQRVRAQPRSEAWTHDVRRWEDANPPPPVTAAHVADHFDYLRETCGVDHVGIGSDFDGNHFPADDLAAVDQFPNLVAELIARHWSEHDLRLVTRDNLLRVLRDTEAVARRLGPDSDTIESGRSL